MSAKSQTPINEKIFLVLFGIAVGLILLEFGLRIGGFCFLYLQEQRNRARLHGNSTYRIMCIGESTTALGGAIAYPTLLEQILNKKGCGAKFSVINKGIPGINSAGLVKNIEGNIRDYKPHVVVAMMGINDFDWNPYLVARPRYHYFSPQGRVSSLRVIKLLRLLWAGFASKSDHQQARQAQFADQAMPAVPLSDKPSREEKAFLDRGMNYASLGNSQQAEAMFRKALAYNPSNQAALTQLGWALMLQEKYENAEDVFQEAVNVGARGASVYRALGFCYLAQRKRDKAESALQQAIAIDPGDNKSYIDLGQLYMTQGKYALAEQIYRRAIAADPRNDRAWGGLASMCLALGMKDLPARYFREAEATRCEYYNPHTEASYFRLKEAVDKYGILLVCVQYPMRSIEPLKLMCSSMRGIIFVDNEHSFKEAVEKTRYEDYFSDRFAGDFGHCTLAGQLLLANNVADALVKNICGRLLGEVDR